MRISKLQKWILTKAYKKIILHDNSGLVILQEWNKPFYCMNWSRDDDIVRDTHKDDPSYWQYLYRPEILLNFFNCETDNKKYPLSRLHHFKGNNNKSQVTLTRSLNNLKEKGLIELWYCWESNQGLTLTEVGKEKALMLIDGHNV